MDMKTSAGPVIRIHPADDVVIARHQLVGGTRLVDEGVTVVGLVPPGHKVAVRPIAAGAPVRRYNQIIGTAKIAIAPGQHVHTHNLEFSSFARDYAAGQGAQPTQYVDTPATFDGIVRADGRIATRNYVGILTSVNCSATVARAIADHFRRDTNPMALARYPNVAVKLCGAPLLSAQAYPFDDVWPYLAQLFDAFGFDRVMWGSDYTRLRLADLPRGERPRKRGLTYADSLDFLRRTDRLTIEEKRLVLGGTARRLLRLPPVSKEWAVPPLY